MLAKVILKLQLKIHTAVGDDELPTPWAIVKGVATSRANHRTFTGFKPTIQHNIIQYKGCYTIIKQLVAIQWLLCNKTV